MGMIADTMGEAVERSQADAFGVLVELRTAETLEVIIGNGGEVRVNVDGVMALRILHVENMLIDETSADGVVPVVVNRTLE